MLNIPALAAALVPLISMNFSCPLDVTALGASLFGSLTLNNMENFSCANGGLLPSGFHTPIVESTNNIEPLKEYFQQREALSIEVWMTPKSTGIFDVNPILTIGRQHDDFRTIPPTDACHDHDLRFSQFGPYLHLSYTSKSGTCETAYFTSARLRANALTHITLTFTSSSTVLYVNGQSVPSSIAEFLDPHLGNWNSTYGLQLFSDYVPEKVDIPNAPDKVFDGTLHLIKMYAFGLKAEDASILFQAGLPIRGNSNGDETDAQGDPLETSDNSSSAVEVPSRLTANFADIIRNEGKTETPFKVGGHKYGVNFSAIMVEIVSLPSQGNLKYNGQPVQQGALLPTDHDVVTQLTYDGVAPDFFNTPHSTADGTFLGLQPDSFDFRLVEMSNVGAKSNVTKVLIRVVNVNDVPELTLPEQVYLNGETTSLGHPFYTISGIHIDDDKDRDVDKIRVDVEALHGNGQLSLNQNYLDLAEFSRCSIRTFSDWRCKGDGRRGTSMTFIATPSDANLLLSRLTYTPYHRETEDEIRIRVYDGAGSDCLDVEEHKLYGNAQLSVHPRCVRKQGIVFLPRPSDTQLAVGVTETDESGDDFKSVLVRLKDTVVSFSSVYWKELVVAFIGLCILVACLWMCCRWCCCRATKEPIPQSKGREASEGAFEHV